MQYFQGSFPLDSGRIPGSGGFRNKLFLPWNDLIPTCDPRNLNKSAQFQGIPKNEASQEPGKNGMHNQGLESAGGGMYLQRCQISNSGILLGFCNWVLFIEPYLRKNIISTGLVFERIGVGLWTKDSNGGEGSE